MRRRCISVSPLSLRQVEDLLRERGIDICHETVRVWWTRFGPMFAGEIRKKRSASMRAHIQWRWHLDEVFVRINGETYDLSLLFNRSKMIPVSAVPLWRIQF